VPLLSQWFIRAALVQLLTGFTFGALMLSNKGIAFEPQMWRLLPAHVELLLMGWTLQLGLGMAFWMLPRFWEGAPRGKESGAWLALFLLNGGVTLVALAAIFGWPPAATLVGRAAEVGAAAAFAWHIWPRIVPRN
jgi:hypothetical protein